MIFPLVLSVLHSRSYLKITVEVRIFVQCLQLSYFLHSIKCICILLGLEQMEALLENIVHAGGEATGDKEISARVTILTCQNYNSINFGEHDSNWR